MKNVKEKGKFISEKVKNFGVLVKTGAEIAVMFMFISVL